MAPPTKAQISMEVRFAKMFLWCYANRESKGNKYVHLASFVSHVEIIPSHYDEEEVFYDRWRRKAALLIPEIEEISLDFIHGSPRRYKSSTGVEIHIFLATISKNLEDLFSSKARMFVHVKEQTELLQWSLKFFGDFVKFTAERCISHEEELKIFRVQLQDWANRVASLLFLYWVDQNEEQTVLKLKPILLHILEIKPCSPVVKKVFLGALKASKCLRSEASLIGNLVANTVDLLLEDLMASVGGSVKMSLRDGLIILTTFLMDPPRECGNSGNEILARADAIVDEAASLISFLCAPEEKEGNPNERYIPVIDFLEKISILKAEIRELYVQIQDLTLIDFPRTNVLGFIDFLLGILKERESSIIFAKFMILALQKKLLSVRDYLRDLLEQQNEMENLKHLWTQIINRAYALEHVLDSCFYEDYPIWHKMICLSILKDELEFVMTEVKKIRDEFVKNINVHSVAMNSNCTILKHAKMPRIDESIVGFKNEATEIIDQLTRGSRELKVVSIVGMPGQGKTTLANKIYNHPSVRYHFNKRAWCFVSQAYQRKELLLNILSGVTGKDDMHSISEEDLAEKLYRSLKGQRYLIVMDDVWDTNAWEEMKESFPNDNNRSRIMLTSRIHSMASQVGIGSSTHLLCPLSIEESWELLQKKLFDEDCCPSYLSEVGMEIVKICEGLPLSIVVVAGILAGKIIDLDWWKEIEGELSSKILGEGCNDILESSYKNLPDILKPCFLYFAAFQQGKPVNAKKLTQLWVAEGFIPKIGVERLEDVAQVFLKDLTDRSLVIVTKRSSSMEIKECRMHDLLFDLCVAKVEQDNFLRVVNDSRCPPDMQYLGYRLSVHSELSSFAISNHTALYARTLLLEGNHRVKPSFFIQFKFLRVLDSSINRFPVALLSLIHLRYLVLAQVLILPPSIENLQNLEVLRVESVDIGPVPDTIWTMKKLRQVYVRYGIHFSLGDHLLECAILDNVDIVSCPILEHGEYERELFKRFPKARKLRIRLCSGQLPALGFLSNLESLNMDCSELHYPSDLTFPSTLKKLTLLGSKLPWSAISVIGKLPNLEILKLLWNSFVGKKWDMKDEEFSKLKLLKLHDLDIQEWNAGSDPFPCLRELALLRCNHLDEIPFNFGEIPTLNVIEIHYCNNRVETSAQKILEERLDMGNDGIEILITKSIRF